jgi:hypothetical protein
MPGGGKINDGQPAVTQGNTVWFVMPRAAVVWTAMHKGVGHLPDTGIPVGLPPRRAFQKSCNATHLVGAFLLAENCNRRAGYPVL